MTNCKANNKCDFRDKLRLRIETENWVMNNKWDFGDNTAIKTVFSSHYYE